MPVRTALADRVAILLDGGFLRKKLRTQLGHPPVAQDIVNVCTKLMGQDRLKDADLFRVFYYDSEPYEGKATNPISHAVVNFSSSAVAVAARQLLDTLELEPDFAVRRGGVLCHGWKLGNSALKQLATTTRAINAHDLVPDIKQKGIDIRIGLDMARLALKQIIEIVVLVTGDSDFVPVMKFARTEGLKVYLEPMGHSVRRELRAHADFVF